MANYKFKNSDGIVFDTNGRGIGIPTIDDISNAPTSSVPQGSILYSVAQKKIYAYDGAVWVVSAGTSGTAGSSGTGGSSGTSGTGGSSGTSGSSGATGSSGTSGTSGANGSSGSSGSTGSSGSSGSSGSTGSSGTAGSSGSTGSSGSSGSSGSTGTSGSSGISLNWRSTYSAGTTYNINDIVYLNGTSYVSLINSNIGNTPNTSPAQWAVIAQAGTSGTSGSSGSSGSSGTSGTRGSSGSSGSSGQSGAAGSSGSSGITGSSGSSGTSGTRGSSGTSGANGAAGSSGSSGQSGAAGSSGSSGSSGQTGGAGSSGTSGTSPSAAAYVAKAGDTMTGTLTFTASWGNAGGDYTGITNPSYKVNPTSSYWRGVYLSQNSTVSGVYNYETGKSVYWGEPTDTGGYYFRGRLPYYSDDAGNYQLVYNSGSWGISVTGNAGTATTFSTGRTNYKGVTDGAVAGQLMWKNYGNSHTIFDASAGTSPSGTTVSIHTPDYPVASSTGSNSWGINANLMGWNGSNTYGVKVDWSRYSESSGNSSTTSQTTFSSLNSNGNVAVNSSNNLSSSSGGLTLWDGGGTTTSWIGFKNNASTGWGTHGGSTSTGAYSTYFIMDTTSRGWIWRFASVGGTNFTGTNVASIQNNNGAMSLGSQWSGTTSNPIFAQLNVCQGVGSVTNYRDIDIKGSWAAGEGHSITATHGSSSTNIVGQITFQHDSPGSRIRFGKLYASGDQTAYPMELISNSSGGGGNLFVTGDITAYYSDERLKTKVAGIDNALDKVLSLSGFKYINNALAKEHGYDSDKVQIGMSAQEVQKVAPEIVKLAHFDMEIINGEVASKSGENYLTLDYSKLVPVLIEAIKEQQGQIEDLKKALFNIIDSR